MSERNKQTSLEKQRKHAAKRRAQVEVAASLRVLESSLPLTQWDEDTTEACKLLYLDGGTYQTDKISDPPKPSNRLEPEYLVSPQENFGYLNAILRAGYPLQLYGSSEPRFVIWNGDVVLPTLVDMRRQGIDGAWFTDDVPERTRVARGAVWMSLTPSEMITQRSGVHKAEGNVVIGGLGLGWFLRKVIEKDAVDEVIVVEKSQELLDWYGYDLCNRYPKVKDVICDDIYRQISLHRDGTQFLLDIWPTYAGASQDGRLREARNYLGNRLWAWGMD